LEHEHGGAYEGAVGQEAEHDGRRDLAEELVADENSESTSGVEVTVIVRQAGTRGNGKLVRSPIHRPKRLQVKRMYDWPAPSMTVKGGKAPAPTHLIRRVTDAHVEVW
jgi:hypothetical protein